MEAANMEDKLDYSIEIHSIHDGFVFDWILTQLNGARKPVLKISQKRTENEQQLLFLAYRFIRWIRFAVMHPNSFWFSGGLVYNVTSDVNEANNVQQKNHGKSAEVAKNRPPGWSRLKLMLKNTIGSVWSDDIL